MTTLLIALNVVMAVALWWKPKCRMFALIQTLQLLEIYPMMHSHIFEWMTWYWINAAVNIVAVFSTKELCISRWLMTAWSAWVMAWLWDKDCAFQLQNDATSDHIYWLGNVVLVTLLGYSLTKPTLWLKEKYASRRSHYPASSEATTN